MRVWFAAGVVAAVGVAWAGCGGEAAPASPADTAAFPSVPPPGAGPCGWVRVRRAIDGDTIVVVSGSHEETVRYIGVNTPELAHAGNPVEAYGPEAATYNRDIVEGAAVCMERDVSDRDRFGRLLRYVWLRDGTLLNEKLVLAGVATVMTIPPDVHYIHRFVTAQRTARAAGAGLWAGIGELPADSPTCYIPGRNGCNCSNFKTQAEAQHFHDQFDPKDTNKLDPNKIGRPCSSLP